MLYKIENERFLVSVDSKGAELAQFFDKYEGIEYIWQGDPHIWKGRSPILFPVVGRLRNDSYRIGDAIYAMPKHGFAKNSDFSVINQQKDTLCLLLTDSSETHKCYPFRFRLAVTFKLAGNRLEITHTVYNDGMEEMLFSIGAHPGLRCEIFDTLIFEKDETSYAYQLDGNALLMDEKRCVPFEGNRLTITPHMFDHDALIFDDLHSRSVTLKSDRHPRRVRVDYFHAPCLGLWSKPGAPYVCIEPWYGIDDHAHVTGELSGKPQIRSLASGETFLFPVHITVE